ncbi:uncharacterized protein LOC143434520 [Arvicanthis niloticus]|uniref:uncharacterized protein LOC143308815 n=1 Tax=Arvicanthis niloticus TaxID=61156 RepID=UPI00402B129D
MALRCPVLSRKSPPHAGPAAQCSRQTASSGLALLALTGLARQSGFRGRWDAEEPSSEQPTPHRLQPPLSCRFVGSEYCRRSAGLDAPHSGRSSRASAPPGGPLIRSAFPEAEQAGTHCLPLETW